MRMHDAQRDCEIPISLRFDEGNVVLVPVDHDLLLERQGPLVAASPGAPPACTRAADGRHGGPRNLEALLIRRARRARGQFSPLMSFDP